MSPRKPKKKKKKKSKKPSIPSAPRQEVEYEDLKALLKRAMSTPLSLEDYEQLTAAIDTLAFLTQELEQTGTTLSRLRKMLFGSSSEKTKDVLKSKDEADKTKVDSSETEDDSEVSDKKKKKGHGRNGADSYVSADQVQVPHESLEHKDTCPCCEQGKVYEQQKPGVLVRVKGVAPLVATVYHTQKFRCGLCGKTFEAEPPEGVGQERYDETAKAMIGLLKYGCGLPFYRIEKLGKNLGIPLPSSTQWDKVEEASFALETVWKELVRLAAQGDRVNVDDTKAKILELNTELQKALEAGENDRTGIFTSGIISKVNEQEIVLFYTGRNHAGENLEELLKHRAEELKPPIQMSDALACNTSGDFETIVASCLVHARRNFVDVADSFPEKVEHVLKQFGLVYKHDSEAKKQEMTDEERLAHHQEMSKPVMDKLEKWLAKQFDERLVEPNSSLGGAIKYMQNHWDKLTLFLVLPGVPLDNNLVERALKRVILHRKNSLFFKTENGARVGDIFMSLIHTCELAKEMPFEYLVAVQKHREQVEDSPGDWLPWNYRETLEQLEQGP